MERQQVLLFSKYDFCAKYPKKAEKYFVSFLSDLFFDWIIFAVDGNDINVDKLCKRNNKVLLIAEQKCVVTDNFGVNKVTYLASKNSFLNIKVKNGLDRSEELSRNFFADLNSSIVVSGRVLVDNVVEHKYLLKCVGEGGSIDLKIGMDIKPNKKAIVFTEQSHLDCNARTTVLVKSVVNSGARLEYNGKIYIDKNANKSVATQANKNIILSKNSQVISTPSLEILNNNVECSHGSTSGYLDEEQIAYCQLFGIDIEEANKLLINGFLGLDIA
ncbi:SufD family Fe-S cluster assembly protein [bacterium]|jgi:Fe-S cluster assembly protein SufD|nr:SufD family Fe-S cluster assembly protein [bacterium]